MINTKLILDVYENISGKSKISTQILYGEKFSILKNFKNFLKIKNTYDGYIGYIKSSTNYSLSFNPSKKIFVLKSHIYKKNKFQKFFKTYKYLTFASKIEILEKKNYFSRFEKNKWIKNSNIIPIKYCKKNFLKIIKIFLNTDYKWGGKTFEGIDCSALLQIFFQFHDKFCPRDSKDQLSFFRKKILKDDFKKGDLIFWKGHIAICINKNDLIHAYGPKKKY